MAETHWSGTFKTTAGWGRLEVTNGVECAGREIIAVVGAGILVVSANWVKVPHASGYRDSQRNHRIPTKENAMMYAAQARSE
jgi:hypothetical protein